MGLGISVFDKYLRPLLPPVRPRLVQLDEFVKECLGPMVLDVFELSGDPEKGCSVENLAGEVAWDGESSLPALLREEGYEGGRPYLISVGFGKDCVACIPRVASDDTPVQRIDKLHWGLEALKQLDCA